ncbi:MAG TPA: fibronectin type III domain-containing protein [Frankiaceae bacterium]|nr:fibronectin type III domain-containing protein [Frankiaceae bacterium]
MRARPAVACALAVVVGCAGLVSPAPAVAAPGATVLEAHTGFASTLEGEPRGIVAHLFDAADEPVAGQRVDLYERAGTEGEWVPAGDATTDEHGAAQFAVTPPSGRFYTVRHAGSPTTAPSDGPVLGAGVFVGHDGPRTPRRVLADPADGAIHAEWLVPGPERGAPITGYVVTAARDDETGSPVSVETGPDAREAVVPGLVNGVPYDVTVTARAGDLSAESPSVLATPSADAPPWPEMPPGGTQVCGPLPLGTTTWTAAGSPYRVCRLGLEVPIGATLVAEGAEVRFLSSSYPGTAGVSVAGGGVRLVDSVLRGEDGTPGEWDGIVLDEWTSSGLHAPRTSSTLSLTRSAVHHAVDAVRVVKRASYLRLDDALLADASRDGLRAEDMPVRLNDVTVRDVGGAGAALTCTSQLPRPCPIRVDGLAVERAGGRGLLVDTYGPASVKGVVVTGSGTVAPVSEAAWIRRLKGSYGAGGDIEDVLGSGNAVDAVVLDLRHTRDLVWRTPEVVPAGTPAPLGFLAGAVRMEPGKSLAFPQGSVVKVVERGGPESSTCWYDAVDACWGGVAVTDGLLDAKGTTFTSAADASAGIATCPSSFAPECGEDTGWRGIAVTGDAATVDMTGGAVRGARAGLAVRAGYPLTGTGAAVAVTGTTFAGGVDGIVAWGNTTNGAQPIGTLALTDVTVEDMTDESLDVMVWAAVHLTRTTVRRAGRGPLVRGMNGADGCPRVDDVRVDGLVVEDVPGIGAELRDLCRPYVRDVTVRRSGAAGPDDDLGKPAVYLHGAYSLGAGHDVHGFRGGGNGLDAVALAGTAIGDVAWVSPRNGATDHTLGYVIGEGDDDRGTLTVRQGTVTVPANGLVAALGKLGYGNANGLLHLRASGIDATAGGARFVNARDPLAAELGCLRNCVTTKWGGIRSVGLKVDQDRTGDVRIVRGTLRGAYLRTASPLGAFALTDSTTDDDVYAIGADRAVVAGSRLRSLQLDSALAAEVVRNTFTGDGEFAAQVAGRGQSKPSAITIRDNVATGDLSGYAYRLAGAHVRLGPSGTVDRNYARGDSAALLLWRVTTAHDVTWVTPSAAPYPHRVGYVLGSDLGYTDPALTVTGPRTLTLPAGAVVKTSAPIRLRGARLDATAGGALITTPSDDVDVCPPDACDNPTVFDTSDRVVVESVPDPATGKAGGIALHDARVHGAVKLMAQSSPAPGSTAYGLVVDSSYVAGGIHAHGSAASITRSRLRFAGAYLFGRDGNLVRDTTFEDMDSNGLTLTDADGLVTESVFRRTARLWDGFGSAALSVWNSAATLSCLDIRENGAGFRAHGQEALALSDSALTGNARDFDTSDYDLDNTVETTTTRVWWGQPGGPVAGQVRDPDRHTDVAPAAAKPACAVAQTATPPTVPLDVVATAGASSVTATWEPPAQAGGRAVSEYRVRVSPGGATRVVPATARTVTVPAQPGSEYAVSVTAVNTVGAGPPSRYSAPVFVGNPAAPKAAAALSASAPSLTTYGEGALVTGTLTTALGALPGRLVEVYVRRSGTASWGTPYVTLVTSPTGTVSRSLRLSEHSEVRLSYAGDAASLPATSAVRKVLVRPVVTAAFSKGSVPAGTTVTLSGRVSPVLAGRPVRVERYTSDGWQRVTTAYLTRTSAYVVKVTARTRGSMSYRVVYDATTRHARAVSPTRTLTVT